MKRTLLGLGGALLLLAAVLSVKAWRDAAAARPHYAFDSAQKTDVVGLRVTYQGDTVELSRDAEGVWRLAPDGFPADTSRLAVVLDRLFRMQNRERVSRSSDSTRLVEYGLNAGEAKRVEWTLKDGSRQVVLLGKTSGADYGSLYWKSPEVEGVYRTPGSFTYDIATRVLDWKERALFPPFNHEEVRTVEVEWNDSTGRRVSYHLERVGDSAYRMNAPMQAPVPRVNGRKVFEQTPQFIADGFADSTDPLLPFSRMDSADIVVRFTMNSGERRALSVGADIGGTHYARHPAVPGSVIRIAKWRLDFFRKTPAELLAPPPADVPNELPVDSLENELKAAKAEAAKAAKAEQEAKAARSR